MSSRARILLIIVVVGLIILIGLGSWASWQILRQASIDQPVSTPTESPTVLPTISVTPTPQPTVTQDSEQIVVKRVVDGDTIELADGRKVRYIGIDTPETVDPRQPVGCYGKEASNANKMLVDGKIVRLERDVSNTDSFGRLLRYVYVGDVFVNDQLVRQGYAHSSSYPPDITYQNQFKAAEAEARLAKRGLWAAC